MKKNKINTFNYDSTFSLSIRIFKENIVPNIGKFVIGIVLMLMASGFIAYRAYLIKPAIDEVFVKKDLGKLVVIPLQIIGVAILLSVVNYLQGIIMHTTNSKISINLQKKIFNKLMHADMDFFQSKSSGKILAHIGGDIGGLMNAINILLTGVIRQAFTVAFLIGLMFSQNVALSFIALFGFPAVIYPVYKIGKRLRKLANINQEEGAELNSMINDSIESIKLVKSYNCENYESKRVSDILEKLYKLGLKMVQRSLITSPLMEMVGSIGFAGVIWYGGKSVIQGSTTQGEFFAFMAALFSVYKPAKSFGNLNIALQTALACARRIFITMDNVPNIKDKKNAKELTKTKGNIEFKNVVFRYPYHDPNEPFISFAKNKKRIFDKKIALNDISFKIPKGKTVALVGHSGSGKSTIFKLISRFYDCQKGFVKIDGENVKNLKLFSLRDSIAIVSQDVRLFNTTIAENIKYGKFEAGIDDIKKAAKLANADEFISEMPNGYKTVIGQNGKLLSGGQRQRLSIARAILKNAPILLLDEATSSLDPISERLIQKSLKGLMKNRTTIIIAHRLSTVINADIIYVMSDGKIIESGNHKELMEKNGAYTNLYKKQFEEKV